jgi:class 3 adenylate cyclase/predicted negative regulator of RcsB-dependent stress response
MAVPMDAIVAGRDALERHSWEEAYQALHEADGSALLDGSGLRMLAEAAWWTGRGEEVLATGERAYSAFVTAGDHGGAAMAAWWLAMQHMDRLSPPLMMAWLARAEQHAADVPEASASGYVAAMRAMMALHGAGDLDTAVALLDQAIEVGTRTGDADLTALAMHMKGRVLCGRGEQADGMALMDEAMVSVVGGELEPFTSGIVYCSMISACSDFGDYRRAAEWTEATTRWCERFSITGFPGICRIHRAEILRMRGDLPTAEEEARRACEEMPRFNSLSSLGFGFYEIAEVRRRLGDFAGAEEAYARAHEHGRDPQPGLSLLRLAQGRLDAAAAGIARALAETTDRPTRVKLLWARAEIALAAGDLDSAAAAADELDSIVADIPGTALEAIAACVRGALRLAQGDADGALADLRRALRGWLEIDAPFEAAEVRMLLGRAYLTAGDEEAATMELRSARAAFERVGAVWAAEQAGELLGEVAASGPAPERVHRALVFTDIVRSTDLIGVIGDEAWESLLAWHDHTLKSLFASHGGEVAHHTGDGFFVAFEDAGSAVRCAIAVQRALAEHRQTHGFAPTVRIGIHAAEATRRGRDYSGAEVHTAARVTDAAMGGEILVTAAAVAEAGAGFAVSEPRAVTLRGVDGPVEVTTVDWR